MDEHPNAGLVRKGLEAFGSGDMETVQELIADDVVWH
ncbi:MAG: nuclear transport factor 2 family protein, partial [Actinobacteria bacterium]|nr:nuclear transport factor 2 family protein [Actinomycetota bacterium]